MKGTNLINVKINTTETIRIATTVKILVTQEEVAEEESSMGASIADEKRFTRMPIVGTTRIMRAKGHHGIRKMEGTVRKLNWKSLTTLS